MIKFFILTFLMTSLVAGECPPGVPVVMCFADPCQIAATRGCPAYPKAECRANYCGGCNAEWFLSGQKVNCNEKPMKKSALGCAIMPLIYCFVEPCKVATCASNQNAVCVNNYCKGCVAEFYENGQKVDC